jgi:methyl coenzyme M reductase alpha subunit
MSTPTTHFEVNLEPVDEQNTLVAVDSVKTYPQTKTKCAMKIVDGVKTEIDEIPKKIDLNGSTQTTETTETNETTTLGDETTITTTKTVTVVTTCVDGLVIFETTSDLKITKLGVTWGLPHSIEISQRLAENRSLNDLAYGNRHYQSPGQSTWNRIRPECATC